MKLQTKIDIPKSKIQIRPTDRLLFVGSCFADNIGKRFVDNRFDAIVNPYGVMYNPASVYHSCAMIKNDTLRYDTPAEQATIRHAAYDNFDLAVFTLGTNHVYIEKATGEIVDNCQKRPQRLFEERELTIGECAEYLTACVSPPWGSWRGVILTISPIRYAKYGFHESQLSKATLMLAAEQVAKEHDNVEVFPAYEIMNDELRDYRFYEPDMLHPSTQAVDYIYERFKETYFSEDAKQMEAEWQPIRQALNHRPFNPDSEEYKAFLKKAKEEERAFLLRWGIEDCSAKRLSLRRRLKIEI